MGGRFPAPISASVRVPRVGPSAGTGVPRVPAVCDCDGEAIDAASTAPAARMHRIPAPGWTRRRLIAAGVGGAAAGLSGVRIGRAAERTSTRSRFATTAAPLPAPVPVAAGLEIHPRDAWGADLPFGPIRRETPRFLLVHHTASTNAYRDPRELIRSVHRFHTSAAKGWPDVCYQFFVGRDGDVWEGRAGALAGPVEADATGGSQGWAQLVCLLGDFSTAPPTTAAVDSLVLLLEWIARRDGIDVTDGATATFVSRGSQRWRTDTTVTTPTISGHRDMSYTVCPGETVFAMLPEIRRRVAEVHRGYTDPPAAAPHPNGLSPARRLGRVTEP